MLMRMIVGDLGCTLFYCFCFFALLACLLRFVFALLKIFSSRYKNVHKSLSYVFLMCHVTQKLAHV
jgi:hypothetical protein